MQKLFRKLLWFSVILRVFEHQKRLQGDCVFTHLSNSIWKDKYRVLEVVEN